MAKADPRVRPRLRGCPGSSSPGAAGGGSSSSGSPTWTLRRRTIAPVGALSSGETVRCLEGFGRHDLGLASEIFFTSSKGRVTLARRRRHAARAKLDRRARPRGPRGWRETRCRRGSRRNRRDARRREGHRAGGGARELWAGEGRAGDQVPGYPRKPQRGARAIAVFQLIITLPSSRTAPRTTVEPGSACHGSVVVRRVVTEKIDLR